MRSQIGNDFLVMNCNGKIWPFFQSVKFDLALFGSEKKGMVLVDSTFIRAENRWVLNKINLFTNNGKTEVL